MPRTIKLERLSSAVIYPSLLYFTTHDNLQEEVLDVRKNSTVGKKNMPRTKALAHLFVV
jgi:hypothetical protein